MSAGIAAFELRDDVVRIDLAQGVFDLEAGGCAGQRDGLEILHDGGLLERGKVESGHAAKLACFVESHPALDGDAAGVIVRALDAEVLPTPASGDDFERIAGGAGLMNDDRGGGAFFGGDFVFVSPAAVVGHGRAFEHFVVEFGGVCGIGDGGVVDEHEDGLALDIDIFVVVPAVFGSDHSVADEDDIGVLHVDLGNITAGERDVVFFVHQRKFLASDCDLGVRFRGDACERHVLQIGSIGIARLQPHLLELLLHVSDGFHFAG